jgi:hypothetical protein
LDSPTSHLGQTATSHQVRATSAPPLKADFANCESKFYKVEKWTFDRTTLTPAEHSA